MRLVIFDVDGTLVDSQHMIVAAMERAFASIGAEPPARQETLSIVGLSLREAMQALTGADAATVDALAESYKAAFFDLRSDKVLERLDLAGRFETIQTADTHPSKPHPAMLFEALADSGIEADRAVMIGDTVFDMQMASAAGIAAIGVAWGYHDADHLQPAGAAHVADDYPHLMQLLEAQLNQAPDGVGL